MGTRQSPAAGWPDCCCRCMPSRDARLETESDPDRCFRNLHGMDRRVRTAIGTAGSGGRATRMAPSRKARPALQGRLDPKDPMAGASQECVVRLSLSCKQGPSLPG